MKARKMIKISNILNALHTSKQEHDHDLYVHVHVHSTWVHEQNVKQHEIWRNN